MPIHSTDLADDGTTDRGKKDKAAIDPRALVTNIPGARVLLGVGHDKVYDLIKAGEIESYLDGRARKITIESIKAYVTRKAAAAKQFEPARHPRSHAA